VIDRFRIGESVTRLGALQSRRWTAAQDSHRTKGRRQGGFVPGSGRFSRDPPDFSLSWRSGEALDLFGKVINRASAYARPARLKILVMHALQKFIGRIHSSIFHHTGVGLQVTGGK
jgi:hypothetical protein